VTPKEQQVFAEGFISRYLASGFGSLPKSEIDLLVFHLLCEGKDYRGKSNYELGSLLRIPEAKVKSLRLNSTLKYGNINSKAILGKVVLRFISSEQYAEFSSGKVELSLEDPIEKREIENFLKVRGFHAEYQLNTEVLKISPTRLFELIIENVENPEAEFNQIVQKHLSETQGVASLINKSLSLKQKFKKLREQGLDAEVLKALVGAAASAL
jgi:hypothetical protein